MSWKEVKLKNILTQSVQNGYSPICPDEPNGKWILGLGTLTDNGLDVSKAKPAPANDKKIDKFLLKKGDFLVSRSNTLDKVGRSALFKSEISNCSYPDLMMRFRVDENKVFPEFLAAFLKSLKAKRHFQSCASGTSGSMVKINKTVVEKLSIPLPPLPEQKAIADLLSTWDDAIGKTERLITMKDKKLKQLTKWLVFGHKRINTDSTSELIDGHFFKYPKDWSYTRIKNVAEELSVRNTNTHEQPTVLSCSKYKGFVNSLDYFGKKVFSDDTSNYKIIIKGQFGYPANHVEEGSIGLLEHCEMGIVSPIYVTFSIDAEKVFAPFLYKVLKTDVYRHIFQIRTSSSVDRRGSLRWGEFSKIRVALPSVEEQKQITETLNTAQSEIDLLKQIAGKYKEQKRGLMQKLLTGIWRVLH